MVDSQKDKVYRDEVLRFVRALEAATGLTPSALARAGGVSHSSLTRFLKNPLGDSVPKSTTLLGIAHAAEDRGVPVVIFTVGRDEGSPRKGSLNLPLLRAMGDRMRLAMRVREIDDSERMATFLEWSQSELEGYLDGQEEMSILRLATFCRRLGVPPGFIVLGDRSDLDQPLLEASEDADRAIQRAQET